jgi:hypothetical protein
MLNKIKSFLSGNREFEEPDLSTKVDSKREALEKEMYNLVSAAKTRILAWGEALWFRESRTGTSSPKMVASPQATFTELTAGPS